MTCVYCREEVKLSVCIKTTPSCIQKKKLKLCFCVWTHMTWPRISEFFFPLKYHLTTPERQLNYLKCFQQCPSDHPTIWAQCSVTKFPGVVSSLNLLEATCLFREYLKCIQLKNCVKSAFYFYCFNGFKRVTMVMCQKGMWLNLVYTCCYSSLSTNHVRCPIMTLNFTIR